MKRFQTACLLLIILLYLAGCQLTTPLPPTETPPPTALDEEDRPFHSRTEGQDGVVTEWRGEAGGHQPGQISPFALRLENHSEAAWIGRYCVYLLAETWQLVEVAREEFALDPAETLAREVDVNFPYDLPPGSYGLALIVQRPTGSALELNYLDVTLPNEAELLDAAIIPRDLVEIARAQCLPSAEAYADSVAPVGLPAEESVRLFYWSYLQQLQKHPGETYVAPLLDGLYRQSPYLSDDFIAQIDDLVARQIAFDPFLCAQDRPKNFTLGAVTLSEEVASVRVQSGLGNAFDVIVVDQGDAWRITDVICIEAEDTTEPAVLKSGTTEEITFQSGALRLPGTLTLPSGDGPHPALITVTGSGADNRDNGAITLPNYHPYRQLANRLQTRGMAVLRYEDRRMVDPTGAGADATAADLLRDAAAAVAYLQSRADIDPDRIGVLGHGMGATVAAMLVAERPDEIAFIVALAAPALAGVQTSQAALVHLPDVMEISAEMAAQMVERESHLLQLVLAEDWEAVEAYLRQIIAEQLHTLPQEQVADVDLDSLIDQQVALSLQKYQSRRFHFEMTYDPAEAWTKITAPVLLLFAEHGTTIFAEDHQPIFEEMLAEAENDDVTIGIVDGVNHLFLDAETGNPLLWPTQDQMVPIRVIAAIVDWIMPRMGR